MSPFWSYVLMSAATALLLGVAMGYLVSIQARGYVWMAELFLWMWVLVPSPDAQSSIAVVALFAWGAFDQLHPERLAARSLGASEWRIFWRIMLPATWFRIFTGTVLAAARAVMGVKTGI
jgi:ABC-type spermidine/putrescine transport system permease subunit II